MNYGKSKIMLLVHDHPGRFAGAVRLESSGWRKRPLMARYARFGLVWLLALCNKSLGILDRVDREEDSVQTYHYVLATHSL